MSEVENYHVCASGQNALRRGEFNLGVFPGLLKKIIEGKMWERRRLPDGTLIKLNNLIELITLPPLAGWGETVENVEALLRKDKKILAKFRKAKNRQGERTDLIDNFHNNVMKVKQGNSLDYTLSRLKRERPDLYERVCNDELSANAAAIKAGFRKKLTPYEKILKELGKLTPDEKQQLRDLLNEDLGRMVRAKTTGK